MEGTSRHQPVPRYPTLRGQVRGSFKHRTNPSTGPPLALHALVAGPPRCNRSLASQTDLLRRPRPSCPALSNQPLELVGPVIHTSKRSLVRGGGASVAIAPQAGGRALVLCNLHGHMYTTLQNRRRIPSLPQGFPVINISPFWLSAKVNLGTSLLATSLVLDHSSSPASQGFERTMFMIRAAPVPFLKYVAVTLMVFSYALLLLPILAL